MILLQEEFSSVYPVFPVESIHGYKEINEFKVRCNGTVVALIKKKKEQLTRQPEIFNKEKRTGGKIKL